MAARATAFMSPPAPSSRMSLEHFALHVLSTWPTILEPPPTGLEDAMRQLRMGEAEEGTPPPAAAPPSPPPKRGPDVYSGLPRKLRVSVMRTPAGYEFTLKPSKPYEEKVASGEQLPGGHPAYKCAGFFVVPHQHSPPARTPLPPRGRGGLRAGEAPPNPDAPAEEQLAAEAHLSRAWSVAVGVLRGTVTAGAPAEGGAPAAAPPARGESWIDAAARRPAPAALAAVRGSDFELRMANPGGLGPVRDALRPWAAHLRTGSALTVLDPGRVDVAAAVGAVADRLRARSSAAMAAGVEQAEGFVAVAAVPLPLLLRCAVGEGARAEADVTAAALARELGVAWRLCTVAPACLVAWDAAAGGFRAPTPRGAASAAAPGGAGAALPPPSPLRFEFRFHMGNALAGLRAHARERRIAGYPVNGRAGALGAGWDALVDAAPGGADSLHVLLQAAYVPSYTPGATGGAVVLDITGGGRQAGESSLACALREGDEEAGLGALLLDPRARVDMCDARGSRTREGYPRTGDYESYATLHVLEVTGTGTAPPAAPTQA